MKSPRHQFILLGLICQGLSWDDYFLPVLNLVLWVICLNWPRKNLRFSPLAEGILLLGGCAAAFGLGRVFGKNTHFFLGHGLTLLQLVRLLRPLDRRETFFTILIALFHLSVACTFLFDLRFLLILLASVILIPRVLTEWTAQGFASNAAPTIQVGPRLDWFTYPVLVLGSLVAFLALPRVFLGAHLTTRSSTATDSGTLLDSVLDPAHSGLALSGRVVMQIEGQDIGYLRCFTLVDYDGGEWSAPKKHALKRLDDVPRAQTRGYEYRRVRVKEVASLGHALPSDGTVKRLTGSFFGRAYQNNYGGVVSDMRWNSRRNTYEYWTSRHPHPEPLSSVQRLACTQFPPASPRVLAWLDLVLDGLSEPLAQARKLEAWLRNKFTYELGAPELNRLHPLEDFLLHQRQGHCERFASALALLLRMKGIPARVVVGYVPTCRNWSGTAYNIRFKDAHAWTEAYFPDLGWVQLDATPRAAEETDRRGLMDLFQDLDLAWSSYVVNFDGSTQYRLFAGAVKSFGEAAAWAKSNLLNVAEFAGLFALLLCWRVFHGRATVRPEGPRQVQRDRVVAGQFYGQLLELLRQRGLSRVLSQTPLEFLQGLQRNALPSAAEVELVTRYFCAARYGCQTLSSDQRKQIHAALEKLATEFPLKASKPTGRRSSGRQQTAAPCATAPAE